MVVPSEIFHIPHAQSLRRYLAEQCARILVMDPTEIWFNETLQGTVLLLAEKKAVETEKSRGVAVLPVAGRHVLSLDPEPIFQEAVYANGSTIEGKWMPVFLSASERSLLAQLKGHPQVKKFTDVATVDVGIVTGANQFFLVPDSTVEEFQLKKYVHPMFGRSEHVQGLVFSKADLMANKKAGLPSNFLWFQEEDFEQLPDNVKKYLSLGLRQNLHKRFKCRTRRVWYKVPSVYTAPVAMLKRAHHYPRMVLNEAKAFTTDTAYRITPVGIQAGALVAGFVNSLTCLTAEMEGRHYGGGVLELVPSEIERLLLPVVKLGRTHLVSADGKFRNLQEDATFLRMQDKAVLGKLGLSKQDQDALYGAWAKLRNRRHRSPSADGLGDAAA
jgi:hypothetical protein